MLRRNQTRKYPGGECSKQSERLDQKGLSLFEEEKISLYLKRIRQKREESHMRRRFKEWARAFQGV